MSRRGRQRAQDRQRRGGDALGGEHRRGERQPTIDRQPARRRAFGGGAGLDLNGQLTAPSYTIQGTIYNDVGSAFSAVNTQLSAISGFSTYYKINSTGPAAQATGTNAMAMGSNAQGSGADAIAIGTNSQATQSGSIAMGMNAASTGASAIAIGTNASPPARSRSATRHPPPTAGPRSAISPLIVAGMDGPRN